MRLPRYGLLGYSHWVDKLRARALDRVTRVDVIIITRGCSALEDLSGAQRVAAKNPSLKILRRLNRIASLPPAEQKAFLQTIDALLKGQEK